MTLSLSSDVPCGTPEETPLNPSRLQQQNNSPSQDRQSEFQKQAVGNVDRRLSVIRLNGQQPRAAADFNTVLANGIGGRRQAPRRCNRFRFPASPDLLRPRLYARLSIRVGSAEPQRKSIWPIRGIRRRDTSAGRYRRLPAISGVRRSHGRVHGRQ